MALRSPARDYLVSMIGELVGTFLFLFFAFAAAQTANQPNGTKPLTPNATDTSKLLYIALAFGASLAANVWVFFRVSGGQFNPAVTLALVLIRAVSPTKALILIPAQLVGGSLAAAAVKGIIPGDDILFAVSLGPGVANVQGLFIELLLTFMLVFTILMLVAEKTKSTFVAPIGIGFSLFIGHLVGIFWTGAGINPARAFSPALIQASFPSYHWIYWLGPALGSFLAAGLYLGLKEMKYELVGGDADKEKREEGLTVQQADLIIETLRGLPRAIQGSGALGQFEGTTEGHRSPVDLERGAEVRILEDDPHIRKSRYGSPDSTDLPT
ncbi:Bcaqp8 [Botrytis cinerea B05.10]|uniref:Aquaporin-8 n=2 Tax=Botryotinia fuckeliana TaxID=40559 RepID=AQP8_BOTFB|nr:Bcaqp8 [Botrytis cinerea B05.10]A0A384JP03.1 RecName: Full=Aquaporin-8 [Botrytis cinerea B05.10]ATZ52240.1 Bcaqp8 [Botrytis cinerea B05.10]EMR89266.1 putative aquaporin protein [Botrytis cinerea BcDW1]